MKKLLAVVASICSTSVAAHAADLAPVTMDASKWFVHVGGAGVFFDPKITSATGLIPGADAKINSNITGTIEVGHYFNKNISVSLFAGIPPTTDIIGAGTAPALRAATVNYGSIILGAQYHFDTQSMFTPYVGGGAGYNIVLSTQPGPLLPGAKLDNSIGGVLQVGADFAVSDHVGLFVDVKKMFSTAHFSAAGGAVDGQLQLNPWIVSTGVSISF